MSGRMKWRLRELRRRIREIDWLPLMLAAVSLVMAVLGAVQWVICLIGTGANPGATML